MMPLTITNDGPRILSSDYWDSDLARRGFFFASFNSGACRLLIPDSRLSEVQEMQTGQVVIISQGPFQGKQGATELLFEDHTETPYSMQLDPGQSDRLLPASDNGRDLAFTAWGPGAVQLFERPAKFRRVKKLPCLEEWDE